MLTSDEIQVEEVMAELTNEITTIYIDRSYRLSNAYTAKLPDYIIRQGIQAMQYDDDNLLIKTYEGNTFTVRLLELGPSQYIDETSIHVEEWESQKVLYED